MFKYHENSYEADLSAPLDISLKIGNTGDGVLAWYLEPPHISPVVNGDFIGEVKSGSSVNFRNITFNPHGHGTHTECMGHISSEIYSVNHALKQYHFFSELLSVTPETAGGDRIITKAQLEAKMTSRPEAVIIRTLPNGLDKKKFNYSNTNPPYLEASAALWLRQQGVEHLLIDLPSVDKEVDNGALAAHKAFWNFPEKDRGHCTITELTYVPNAIKDSIYLLNLQTAPFENDASPARPVLFELKNV